MRPGSRLSVKVRALTSVRALLTTSENTISRCAWFAAGSATALM